MTHPQSRALLARYLLVVGCLSIAVFFAFTVCSAGQGRVTRVVDGDTIKVKDATGELTVRLVDIDDAAFCEVSLFLVEF